MSEGANSRIQIEAVVASFAILGRNLNKVIMIDNVESNFELQPENCILITSFFGENDDRALYRLSFILKGNFFLINIFIDIVNAKYDDVKIPLKTIKN